MKPMGVWRSLHIKIRWVAIIAALCTAVQAGLAAGDITAPTPVASGVTGILSILAGYLAPTHGEPQDG